MAKNKNRKQTGRRAHSPRAGAQQAKATVTETGTDLHTEADGGSAPGPRTRQRRFGHN
jgi:hypothetical protein